MGRKCKKKKINFAKFFMFLFIKTTPPQTKISQSHFFYLYLPTNSEIQ